MEFRPNKRESGLRFGLTWSAVGSVMAVGLLASCSYIIPPDNNPPRHNQLVDGAKRRPAGNQQVGAPRQTIQQQLQGGFQQSAPRPPAGQPLAPLAAPVAPTAQQIEPNPFVSQQAQPTPNYVPSAVPAAPRAEPNWLERNFPATADWLGVSSNPRRPVEPAAGQGAAFAPIAPTVPAAPAHAKAARPFSAGQPETARALAFAPDDAGASLAPIPENILHEDEAYQTASNSSYPLLSDTPPAPKYTDEAAQKLERARRALEADKRNADQARDDLNEAVQQGDSLLEEYGYQPPGQPLSPRDGAARQHIPSFDEEFGFAAPAPRPAPAAPLEPIVLRPPQSAPVPANTAAPKVLQVSGASPRVISGSSNAYLPESRYTNRR